MSQLRVDLKALYTEDKLSTGNTGAILQGIEQTLVQSDTLDTTGNFASYRFTATSGLTLDLNSFSGTRFETLALLEIHSVIVVVRRTAEVISGTFAISSTPIGISSGTKTASATTFTNKVPIGGPLYTLMVTGPIGVAPGGETDLAITMTSPVGFEIDVLVTGVKDD